MFGALRKFFAPKRSSVAALAGLVGNVDAEVELKRTFPSLTSIGYERMEQLAGHYTEVWHHAQRMDLHTHAQVKHGNVSRMNPYEVMLEEADTGYAAANSLLRIILFNPDFLADAPFRALAFAMRHDIAHIIKLDPKTSMFFSLGENGESEGDTSLRREEAERNRHLHKTRLNECDMDWCAVILAETPEQGMRDIRIIMDYLAAKRVVLAETYPKQLALLEKNSEHPKPMARLSIAERRMKNFLKSSKRLVY